MAARTTLESLRLKYEAQRKRQGMSKSTLTSERCALRHLCRAWDETRRVPKSMEQVWMEDYLFGEGGLAEGLEPSTYNKMVGQQRGFIEWCIRRDDVRGDILSAMIRKSQGKKDYVRLTAAQLRRTVESASADPWEQFVLEFGIHTMGRWSELRIAQFKHLDLAEGKVKWWREKTDEWDELPIMAELDSAFRKWIVAYERNIGRPLQADDYLIPMRVAGGWHPKWEFQYVPGHAATESIRRCVKKHVAPIVGGVEQIIGQGVHLLRRSAARALYDALVSSGHPDPIRIVMAMLGHKNAHTTEIYLGIERDRQNRDTVLRGASFLSADPTNVVELKRVASG